MSQVQGNWLRVSRSVPCPVCGKSDNCTVTRDGKYAYCGRIQSGSLRQNHGGQYLHVVAGTMQCVISPSSDRITRPHKKDFSALAFRFFEAAEQHRNDLSEILHVDRDALRKLHVGWSETNQFWSFAERDATGKIIGINARYRDGSKKRLRGSQAGLTYADTWNAGQGPILLVEGGSDTAALLGLGLNVVGRPSNRGGVDLLSILLLKVDRDREIIVIGERDEKPDGRWPGKEGAIATAEKLSELLDRPIAWSLPPDHAKDAREWLIQTPKLPRDRLADLFASGLNPQEIRPLRRFRVEMPLGPAILLENWRETMRQSRIHSLNQAGLYVDASTTGAGKSHADRMTILHLMSSEEAA